MIEELVTARGFSPEPEHGALITGLHEQGRRVLGVFVPADPLANIGAERLSAIVGDTCIVSLLAGRHLEPIAIADPLQEAVALLAPQLHQRIPAGQRHELAGYIAKFGLGGVETL